MIVQSRIEDGRRVVQGWRAAAYAGDPAGLLGALRALLAPDALVQLAFPFEKLTGPEEFYTQAYRPLLEAFPDLERRDFICLAGQSGEAQWVGCAGHYLGVFERPWLGIPPTRQLAGMRYHEFFRVVEGQVVEIQALWDIPHLMMQAQAWPLAPSLGVDWLAPGPATQDGLGPRPDEAAATEANRQLVMDMLTAMGRHPLAGGVEVMQLEKYWHPRMNWYGPAGIGSFRGLAGFRRGHQIPFLKAMPDRTGSVNASPSRAVLFADGAYVATTGWPNMQMTLTGDGWLGIAPAGQPLTMRSLDFWRCENGLIRENWVLVDLLHVYHQLGVDVLARMRELTHARQPEA